MSFRSLNFFPVTVLDVLVVVAKNVMGPKMLRSLWSRIEKKHRKNSHRAGEGVKSVSTRTREREHSTAIERVSGEWPGTFVWIFDYSGP